MFTAMTKEEAEQVAELMEANGVDEARLVENEYGWSVQIWVYGRGDPDACYVTLDAATLHAAGGNNA